MLDWWQLDQNVDVVVVSEGEEEGFTVKSGWEVNVTQTFQPLPLASSGWKDQRRRWTSHVVVSWLTTEEWILGKGSLVMWSGVPICMRMSLLRQKSNYPVSRQARGMQSEIPGLWVVPSHLSPPYGSYFILSPSPLGQGISQLVWFLSRRKLKPVFSVNDRILYVVVSLTGLCSSVFHRTQFNLPICRSGIQWRPTLEGKKITQCVVFSQHSTFGPKQPWRRSIYGFMWMKCAHRVIACWCWLVQGCFVMLGV